MCGAIMSQNIMRSNQVETPKKEPDYNRRAGSVGDKKKHDFFSLSDKNIVR